VSLFDAEADVTELLTRLGEWEAAGNDLGPTMALIAEDLVTAVQDEFETEGRGKWPGFAESTLATRAGGKLLQDHGILAGSIEPRHGSRFAEASTGVDYAVHHIFGAPKGHLPQRNFFDIDEAVFEQAAALIAQTVADG
jgi:phage gpG-like protein